MATSFGALCNDFFINQKLALKMDLPTERETVLHLFDRIRRSFPMMDRFKRFEDELALESTRKDACYRWMALRRTSIRTGLVNPQRMEDAYEFHQTVLEVAPFHLSISPLDIDHLELMYGFDLECKGNHDEVIYEALLGQSPLSNVLAPFHRQSSGGAMRIINVQPALGVQLTEAGDVQAYFEVKTRPRGRKGQVSRSRNEPICVLLTVRRYGPVDAITDLDREFKRVRDLTEQLVGERLVPDLLTPIARHITSST